jgi:hypothetical protein
MTPAGPGYKTQNHSKNTFDLQGTNSTSCPSNSSKWKTIDRVKSEAVVHAESKCSKFCMGEVDFLVNFNMIRGCKFCWKMIVKKL